MKSFGHTARKRMTIVGLLALPLAVGGWLFAGAAQGAGTAQPSMQVLPKATGLHYGQSVEIKGHNLPKGSGSVAATICGLQDASGKTIANPGANDCAGASEIGKLVIVKSWSSNGEFDTQYTLPQSGQKFGTNTRFCDHAHRCALVVADANPNNPAYHLDTPIFFVDQQPTTTTTKPKTTTTKPTPTTAPRTTTTAPRTTTTAGGSTTTTAPAPGGSGSVGVHVGVGVTIDPPSGANPNGPGVPAVPAPPVSVPPVTVPAVPAPVAQALAQVCGQLATAVRQAGGDPSALLAACSAIESGNGPQQLVAVLESPTLLCVEGASAWQNNQQITDACNQAAGALAPLTSQLASTVTPILGLS